LNGIAAGREECPVAATLPTGVPSSRLIARAGGAAKNHDLLIWRKNHDNALQANVLAPVLTLE
jgi:hypothetical protein